MTRAQRREEQGRWEGQSDGPGEAQAALGSHSGQRFEKYLWSRVSRAW